MALTSDATGAKDGDTCPENARPSQRARARGKATRARAKATRAKEKGKAKGKEQGKKAEEKEVIKENAGSAAKLATSRQNAGALAVCRWTRCTRTTSTKKQTSAESG